MRHSLWLAALSLLLAAQALAQVPVTMSYQGVLTDPAGALVPDGTYDLTFKLYAAATGGTALWTEAHTGATNHVQVTRGGFGVSLGSLSSLAALPFDAPLWLGISVGTDPELTPRTALAASPYALGLQLPFSLKGASASPLIAGYDLNNGTRNVGGAIDLYNSSGHLTDALEPEQNGVGGFLSVAADTVPLLGFFVGGSAGGRGNPVALMEGNASLMGFDMSQTGDNSVLLPTGAIDADEILDEPGIAQGHANGLVDVPVGSTMNDLVTVTLTTPAAGYIVVQATGEYVFDVAPTVGEHNVAFLQIDENSGGAINYNHYIEAGYDVNGGTDSRFFLPLGMSRTYFKAAGTYTFRLEGYTEQLHLLTSAVQNPSLTATYYPTSYGAVTTAPTDAERPQFTHVTTTMSRTAGPGGGTRSSETVDLRELEVRAAQAAAANERAQRRLLEARLAEQAQARLASTRQVRP